MAEPSSLPMIRDLLPDLLVRNIPWFPYGVEVVSQWQIPVIPKPDLATMPQRYMAFDKRRRGTDAGDVLMHFYVDDVKLRRRIHRPQLDIERFAGTWGLLSPDYSIDKEMPIQFRVTAVWANRCVGAFYAAHGLRVIPSIRWCDSSDFGFCFLGVQEGSAVGVSNHGIRRTPPLWQGFLAGLPEMIERLQPPVVFVHGTTDHLLFRQLGRRTEFVHVLPDRRQAESKVA